MISGTVYRVQDVFGRGPYRPGFSTRWRNPEFDNPPSFLVQFPDILPVMHIRHAMIGGHFGCGFRTMHQLHKWFLQSEIDTLLEFGYFMVEIPADDIMIESENQLVFWCKKPLHEIAKVVE